MLNKLLLNNQLVANKKKVQQGKVQVINKLVHKIRKLQNITEKHPDNKKIISKLDRTRNIFIAVKGFKSVQILKKSLLNDKNPTNIITNGQSKPEDVAYAFVFMNKIILDVTKQLKELFLLNENDNPGWKEQLLNLGKKQKKKSLQKDKTKQESRKSKRYQNSWIEENLPSKESHQGGNFQSICSEDLEVNDQSNSKSKTEEDKPTTNKNNEQKKIRTPIKNENKSVECTRTLDPFFVISTGENYMATAPLHNSQDESNNDKFTKSNVNNKRKLKTGNNLRGDKMFNKINSSIVKNDRTLKNSRKPISNEIMKTKGTRTEERNAIKEPVMDEKKQSLLHPSWEAKQKLKPKIEKFQGTKIVFDDD